MTTDYLRTLRIVLKMKEVINFNSDLAFITIREVSSKEVVMAVLKTNDRNSYVLLNTSYLIGGTSYN